MYYDVLLNQEKALNQNSDRIFNDSHGLAHWLYNHFQPLMDISNTGLTLHWFAEKGTFILKHSY